MVTKRSEKSSPLGSSERTPNGRKERSKAKKHKKPKQEGAASELPMTIGSFQQEQDPGTKEKVQDGTPHKQKERRASKPKGQRHKLRNERLEGMAEAQASRDFPVQTDSKNTTALFLGDNAPKWKDADPKHLIVKAKPKEITLMLETDGSKSSDPHRRTRGRL